MRVRLGLVSGMWLALTGCVLSDNDDAVPVDAARALDVAPVDAAPTVDASPFDAGPLDDAGAPPRCLGTTGLVCLRGRADDLTGAPRRQLELTVEIFDREAFIIAPGTAPVLALRRSASSGVDAQGRYAVELDPALLPSGGAAVRVTGAITMAAVTLLPPQALTAPGAQQISCVTPYFLSQSAVQLGVGIGLDVQARGAAFVDYRVGAPGCLLGEPIGATVTPRWNGASVTSVMLPGGGSRTLALLPGNGTALERGEVGATCALPFGGGPGVMTFNGPPSIRQAVVIPGVATVLHLFGECR